MANSAFSGQNNFPKDLKAINEMRISLVVAGETDTKEESETKKYSVCDKMGIEVLRVNEQEQELNDDIFQVKSMILKDAAGTEFYKIVHYVGRHLVNICSINGEVLGETTVSIGSCFCCTLKPKYTYRLKSGKDYFVLKGSISSCRPRLKIKVLNENGIFIGNIKMGNTLTYKCCIKFELENSVEDRLILVALCIGLLDSAYEEALLKEQRGRNRRIGIQGK